MTRTTFTASLEEAKISQSATSCPLLQMQLQEAFSMDREKRCAMFSIALHSLLLRNSFQLFSSGLFKEVVTSVSIAETS